MVSNTTVTGLAGVILNEAFPLILKLRPMPSPFIYQDRNQTLKPFPFLVPNLFHRTSYAMDFASLTTFIIIIKALSKIKQNVASFYTKPTNLAKTQPVDLEGLISGCSRLASKPTGQLRPLPSQLEFPFSFSFLYPFCSFTFLYVWSYFSKIFCSFTVFICLELLFQGKE